MMLKQLYTYPPPKWTLIHTSHHIQELKLIKTDHIPKCKPKTIGLVEGNLGENLVLGKDFLAIILSTQFQ